MGRKGAHHRRIFDPQAIASQALIEVACDQETRKIFSDALQQRIRVLHDKDSALSDKDILEKIEPVVISLVDSCGKKNAKTQRKIAYQRSVKGRQTVRPAAVGTVSVPLPEERPGRDLAPHAGERSIGAPTSERSTSIGDTRRSSRSASTDAEPAGRTSPRPRTT